MTQRTDMERVLDIWLADGPTLVPDRVFADAVAAVYRAPQRSPWRLRWRNLSMNARLLAASIIVLALVGVGIYAVYPGLVSEPGQPTAVPSTTPAPTESPTPGASTTLPPVSCLVDGSPKEPCKGRMDAARYRFASPLVPFSLAVPAGWFNRMNVLGGAMLERDGDVSNAAIYIWPDPVIADQQRCVKAPDPDYGRTARDIVAFLTDHAGLEATQPTDVVLGNLRGWRLELAARTGPFQPCRSNVQLFVHADTIEDGFWWDLSGDRRMAIWILDAGDGHTVLVNVEARQPEYDAFLEAATPIVESLMFTRQAQCVDASRCLGDLAPGTYTSAELEVPLTFTVPAGWTNDWDVPLGYALVPADAAEISEPGIFIFLDVYASNQAACTRTQAAGVGRASADLVAWLGSLPDLSLSAPQAVTVGGLSGTRVDVAVASASPVCSGDYQLWISDYGPLWWGLTPGHPQRHYLLDLPGRHNVLIVVPAPEGEFDAIVASVEPIIASFAFAP